MAPLEILIAGCGIAGSTLASFLLLSDLPASQKPHITILERAPRIRAEGQNIDIRGEGLVIMRKLGLEAVIRNSTTGEEGVQWVDEKNAIWFAFGADRSGELSTPTADIEILRGRLAEICWQRSKSISDEVQREGGAGIDFIFGDYLDEIEQDGSQVFVHLAKSGQRRKFDIVVGADGLQSRTRNLVWGAAEEEDRVKRLGMYAGFFSMPKASTDSLWRRWFHATRRRGIMLRPSDQKDKTTAFVYVISEQDDRFVQVAQEGRGGVQAQKKLLEEYFKDAGWESERVIREMHATDDFYYDFVAQVKMDKWSKGRVVLLGDAAYCASPLSGMGTTLAFTGAYNLAGALIHNPNDHTAAFADYEKKMRPLVDRAQKLAPGFLRIAGQETAWGIWTVKFILYFFWQSGLQNFLFKIMRPAPENEVRVEEYGFKKASELVVEK